MNAGVRLPVMRIAELAAEAGFRAAMTDWYADLDRRIAEHRPVCRNRGACCRFGEFGHRLYVTPVELSFFAASLKRAAGAGARHGGESGSLPVIGAGGACPYQVDGVCSAREGRPVGCRVFFCESAGEGWQEALSERALGELKQLHERFDVPYAYAEWLGALEQVRLGRSADRAADSGDERVGGVGAGGLGDDAHNRLGV